MLLLKIKNYLIKNICSSYTLRCASSKKLDTRYFHRFIGNIIFKIYSKTKTKLLKVI